MGNTDFPHLWGNDRDIFQTVCIGLELVQIRNRLRIWLDHHGLILINIQLYHRGTTFSHFCGKLSTCEGMGLKPSQGLRFFTLNRNRFFSILGKNSLCTVKYFCSPKRGNKPFKMFAYQISDMQTTHFRMSRNMTPDFAFT